MAAVLENFDQRRARAALEALPTDHPIHVSQGMVNCVANLLALERVRCAAVVERFLPGAEGPCRQLLETIHRRIAEGG